MCNEKSFNGQPSAYFALVETLARIRCARVVELVVISLVCKSVDRCKPILPLVSFVAVYMHQVYWDTCSRREMSKNSKE